MNADTPTREHPDVVVEPDVDLLPAIPQAQPVDVVAPIGLPSAGEWTQLQSMAEVLSRSGLVPSGLRRKPDDIMLILLTGRDLRLQATTALAKIHVIEGKPTISAELMAGLVNRQPNMAIWPDPANDAKKATAHATRDGRELRFSFGEDDARRAGLAGKGNWAKWPQFMLWARAVSGLCRMAFSDVLAGVAYTPEELGANVNPETGDVLDVTYREVAPAPPESPFISPANVVAVSAKATAAGLSQDEMAEMADRATGGRTDQLDQVHKSEVAALRDAMAYLVKRKQPAAPEGAEPHPEEPYPEEEDPGRPFDVGAVGERIRAAIPPKGTTSPCTVKQRTAVNAALSGLGITGDQRKPVLSGLVARPIASSSDLTFAEASALINEFKETA